MDIEAVIEFTQRIVRQPSIGFGPGAEGMRTWWMNISASMILQRRREGI